MNHAASPYHLAPVIERTVDARIETQESLLDRITARLIEYTQGAFYDIPVNQKPKCFIEENLLDPRMGPEISRTLRR